MYVKSIVMKVFFDHFRLINFLFACLGMCMFVICKLLRCLDFYTEWINIQYMFFRRLDLKRIFKCIFPEKRATEENGNIKIYSNALKQIYLKK